MKIVKTLLCGLAVASCIVFARASEVPVANAPGVTFTITGTAEFIKTNHLKSISGEVTGALKGTTTTISVSFNTKTIYNLISNAVAHAETYSTNLSPAHFPANGYIVFRPLSYDGALDGYFYVTNKSRFSYKLSGLDNQGNYYSWMELDTKVPYAPSSNNIVIDFGENFNDIYSSSYNAKTGSGTSTITATGLLFIHDNPYDYDDADYTYQYYAQNIGIEISGLFKATLTYQKGKLTKWTSSLAGHGNIDLPNFGAGDVTTGSVTFSPGVGTSGLKGETTD